MKRHVIKGCYGKNYSRIALNKGLVGRHSKRLGESKPMIFGMKMKIFSCG